MTTTDAVVSSATLRERVRQIDIRIVQLRAEGQDADRRFLADDAGASEMRRTVAADLDALRDERELLAAELTRVHAEEREVERQDRIAAARAAEQTEKARLDAAQDALRATWQAFDAAVRTVFDVAIDYGMAAHRSASAQGFLPDVRDTMPERLLRDVHGKLNAHYIASTRHEQRFSRRKQQAEAQNTEEQ